MSNAIDNPDHLLRGVSNRGMRRLVALAAGLLLISAIAQLALVALLPDPEVDGARFWPLGHIARLSPMFQLELAGQGGAAELLDGWGAKRWIVVGLLVADTAFIYGYVVLLTAALTFASDDAMARGLSERAVWLARFSWIPMAAGIADAVENAALLRMVGMGGETWVAEVAFVAAIVKMCLVFFALLPIALPGGLVLATGLMLANTSWQRWPSVVGTFVILWAGALAAVHPEPREEPSPAKVPPGDPDRPIVVRLLDAWVSVNWRLTTKIVRFFREVLAATKRWFRGRLRSSAAAIR